MGGAVSQPIDIIIQVDPAGYYQFPYKKKYEIARIIGRINKYFKSTGKKIMLLAPGRIGTTSPELGITVSFAEISNIKVVCEVSYKEAGYLPELSFGTHFFQDLVESGIFYASIFEDDNTIKYDADFFKDEDNILQDICDTPGEISDIVRVYDISGKGLFLFSDIISNITLCGIK